VSLVIALVGAAVNWQLDPNFHMIEVIASALLAVALLIGVLFVANLVAAPVRLERDAVELRAALERDLREEVNDQRVVTERTQEKLGGEIASLRKQLDEQAAQKAEQACAAAEARRKQLIAALHQQWVSSNDGITPEEMAGFLSDRIKGWVNIKLAERGEQWQV